MTPYLFGHLKTLTRSTRALVRLRFHDAQAFLGMADLLSFFALFSSVFVGSMLKTTKRLSAVNSGRESRPGPQSIAGIGVDSSGGGAGGRYRGRHATSATATLRTTISLSVSWAINAYVTNFPSREIAGAWIERQES
jgi:hypothetical protein